MSLRLWDVVTGKMRCEFPAPGSKCSIGFEADGKTLTSVGEDGILTSWDLTTGKETGRIRLEAWEVGRHSIAPRSPDRKLILGPGKGATVGIWEAATGRLVRQIERLSCRQWIRVFAR